MTLSGARNEFSGNDGNGIFIATEGNISLANVIADNTISGEGINLYNAGFIDATGNVTITAASNFWNSTSKNHLEGLLINTNGTVSISRLRSNENSGIGIKINNHQPNDLVKNVILTSVDANRNSGSHGLYISSLGAVALNSTRADSNRRYGIEIITDGAVSFNGVSASFNSIHEADILVSSVKISERLTSDAEGDIWHFVGSSAIPYTITLSSADFDAYLWIYHYDALTETWVPTIYKNDNYGVGQDAQVVIPSGVLADGDLYYVLVTTADQWGKPGDYDLYFNGSAAIYAPPQAFGAIITNSSGSGNVTISSPSTFRSSFSENRNTGLQIDTKGAVSITNTDARDNGSDGVYVREYYPVTSVTIRNTLTTRIMSFSNNGGFGIRVPAAYGAITLSGLISASDNRWTGAYLRNNGVPDLTPMAVTITSLTANGNGGAGIDVISKGNITLTNITANKNQDAANGVVLNNYYSIPVKGYVTINGSNIISGNTGDGLAVNTGGTLSITRCTGREQPEKRHGPECAYRRQGRHPDQYHFAV